MIHHIEKPKGKPKPGSAGGVIIPPTNLTVTAGSQFSGSFGPERIIDGNDATAWVSANGVTGDHPDSWIQFNSDTPFTLDNLYILQTQLNVPAEAANKIRIFGTDDELVFDDLGEFDISFRETYIPILNDTPYLSYRIRVSENDEAQSANNWAFREVDVNYGYQIDLIPDTPIAGSVFNASFQADKAYDGNVNTGWASGPVEWIGKQKAAAWNPGDTIRLRGAQAAVGNTTTPELWDLIYTNDFKTWTVAATVFCGDPSDAYIKNPATGINALAWAMRPSSGDARQTSYVQVNVLEFNHTQVGTKAFGYTEFSGSFTARNMINGNPGTYFATRNAAEPKYAGLVFPSPAEISQLEITWSNPSETPQNTCVAETSIDGLSWTIQDVAFTPDDVGMSDTISFTPVTANYIRVRSTVDYSGVMGIRALSAS